MSPLLIPTIKKYLRIFPTNQNWANYVNEAVIIFLLFNTNFLIS